MKGYLAFVKKEWRGQIRNYQLFSLAMVFLLIGFMNPITAKIMPTVMEGLLPKNSGMTIPDATVMDSWQQFFKNVPQLGLIVVAILLSSMLTKELSKGTLILSLTKGLKRSQVILAKYTVAAVNWTLCLWGCFGISYGYTMVLFKDKQLQHILFATFLVWLFGLWLATFPLLFGVLFDKNIGVLLAMAVAVVVGFLMNFNKMLQDYNPINLVSKNMSLLDKSMAVSDFNGSILVTIISTFVFLYLAIYFFEKKIL